MTSIKVEATGALITAAADGRLTSGMVGIPVSITYDSAWDGLTKTVVFRAGELARGIKNAGSEVTVPWEVMRKAGKALCVGVEGRNSDGTLVMPTVWAQVGVIERGANADVPGAGIPETEDSGGGGIAISGATVGQTVKIAAVDENGVPAAWEAADFPVEKWEPILAYISPRPTLVNLCGFEGLSETTIGDPHVYIAASGTTSVVFNLSDSFKRIFFKAYNLGSTVCTSGNIQLSWGNANSGIYHFAAQAGTTTWSDVLWDIEFRGNCIFVHYGTNSHQRIIRSYDTHQYSHTNKLTLTTVSSGATFNSFYCEIWGVRA